MLQVRGLRKSYSGTEVVCGVSFSVAAGKCYGLLGSPRRSAASG